MQEHARVSPSWGRRLAGIEGLRGLAALSVLCYHIGLTASYQVLIGPTGVVLDLLNQGLTLFFVLSGFLLYRPFATTIFQERPLPSIKRYATNRLLRIYPGYLVIFAVTALVVGEAYLKGSTHGLGPDNIGRLTDPIQILSNALLVQMFIPPFVMSGLPVSWSLTAEITFYLVLPVASLIAARRVRRGAGKTVALATVPAVMVLTGLFLTLWSHLAVRNLPGPAAADFAFGQTGTAVLLRSFLAQADLFGYGMFAAVVVVFLHERDVQRVSTGTKAVLVIAAVTLVLAAEIAAKPLLINVSGIASALVLLAVVLPSAGHGGMNRLARVFEWLPFRFTGLISYSIYLWHLPIIFWLITHNQTFGQNVRALPLNALLVLAITVPLAAATYYFVERPAMKLKKPMAKPRQLPLRESEPVH